MANNVSNSHTHVEQSSAVSAFSNEEKKPMDEGVNASIFVNQAAITWHENRRQWIGDQSRKSQRVAKDPVISWSTTYEDLLSTNEPFSQRIPLSEMVDFLVDIWHEEGLYD
ncbi:uncharacterized protein LOC122081955 [Macadamia integrifolia]|uniref:uncharacterized protein LOC122081955 n=1 Tax=Macadamia integrifolia TaxID=60698 RepID=UPI001C4F0E15|nr:uncharacterized protein LOC122081955 [Macadamia integrifolia]XP_042505325.1 uncharacterized protein LOC122081955 [Macadamia integrifolia]XP_042505327.1 uncharacterized protein LOC122081955 [Macadamia integrifolia]